ncbi:hypothetical protein IXB50_15725 [Leptothoe spongobia TAU-MAC 1115]|uniref:Uncharacterized protein n=1 Tax=Leptothoe spongobia TAU-MAC 1115 TaxID=1967444 RepID=A0A947DHT7_9CYAN|nr:hypothetical protein [Leptothoe spongobia TAU-MAC 1115]
MTAVDSHLGQWRFSLGVSARLQVLMERTVADLSDCDRLVAMLSCFLPIDQERQDILRVWVKTWRRIAIPANLALDELAIAILDAYQFDYDHLYEFSDRDRTGRSCMTFRFYSTA